MSQNQEIIESKLCAYIDGELDPEGRAEIEKHLEANPQHRRLLESLRATRDLIRWLPREPAPPELAETLGGQLERSVLLNYEGDSLRTPIWPRFLAAAAIFLLTAGLGVAVYYALPRSQKPAQLALHTLESESDSGEVVPAPPAGDLSTARETDHLDERDSERMKDATADLKKETRLDKNLADESPKAAPPVMSKNGPGNQNVKDLDLLAEQVGQNPKAFLASAEGANNAVAQNTAPANYNALVVLVRSNAPEQTEKHLTSYLNQQQIVYRRPPVAQQPPGAIQEQQQGGWAFQGEAAKSSASSKGEATVEPPVAPQTNSAATQLAQNGQAIRSQAGLAYQEGVGGGAGGFGKNNVFVCQMSRRQAELLNTTLGDQAVPGNQVQNLNAFSYYSVNSVDRGAGQNASMGELSQTQAAAPREMARREVGREQVSQASPQTQPAAIPPPPGEFKLGATGSGPTTQPASSSITTLNPSRDLSGKPVQLAATQPVSRPADVDQIAAPTSQASQGLSVDTTAPADEPVNVVILVQPNTAAAGVAPAAALPATQPASEPSQQKANAAPVEQQPSAK